MTAPTSDTETKVELEIPCECDGHDSGCERAATVWVIHHDICGSCLKHENGIASEYLCDGCWGGLSDAIDRAVAMGNRPGHLVLCAACQMPIRRRSDVVHKITVIRGTKQ